MIGKRCPSFSYLSENYSQNLRISVSSNRDSKMFAISDVNQPKNPAPEMKRGFGLRLEVELLAKQRQYLLRRHICLGKHGSTGLEQDLVLGKACHL